MTDCFVHASDLHLDAPLGDLGFLDDEARDRLAIVARLAWSNLVDLTISEEASFLVLAGDIFHSGVGNPGVQRMFLDGLRLLCDKQIPVLICHGNHDPLTADFKWIGDRPDTVTIFPSGDSPLMVEVPLRSGGTATVSGLSFGKQHETDNLAVRFGQLEPVSRPHVAVLHANLAGSEDHDPYAPCSIDDLQAAPVDYWALGHIHLRKLHELGPNRYAAYCGNLQGRTFKRAECHPKGAYVVPIEGGQIGKPKFHPCDRIRFVIDEIKIGPEDDINSILELIDAATREAASKAENRPVIWSLTLVGQHHEPAAIRRLIDHDHSDFSDALGHLPEILNGGGLAIAESRVILNRTRQDLIAEGGFRATVMESLDDEEKIRSTIKRLVEELPALIPREVLAEGNGDIDINALVRLVQPFAEELLLDKFGNSESNG